jgi:hypothetical protein
VRFSDVANFTTPTPLSLLLSSTLSFPIVDVKICSLLTLALNLATKFSDGM